MARKARTVSAIDRKIDNFSSRLAQRPNLKVEGQIRRNFGMYPPAYWQEAQMSRPGPMGGGTPINLNSKQFTHGLEW